MHLVKRHVVGLVHESEKKVGLRIDGVGVKARLQPSPKIDTATWPVVGVKLSSEREQEGKEC